MSDGADKILTRVDGAVGHVIFNNPEKRNAVSLDMWDAVGAAFERFETDPDVRVVVVSGAGGKSFVAGADISKFETERGSEEAAKAYAAKVQDKYRRILSFPKPVIAMIDGFCLGGGLNLAIICDIRICSDKSRFGMPAARLGLGYPFASIKRLMDLIGPLAARHLMFTGERIDAAEAYRIGFVHKVVPAADLNAHVADYAAGIAANAPLTVTAMKLISAEVLKDPAERDMALCEALVDACFGSEDYVEGRTAFLEKRPPSFKGR